MAGPKKKAKRRKIDDNLWDDDEKIDEGEWDYDKYYENPDDF